MSDAAQTPVVEPAVAMRSFLQRIATGPELSKDLSREEARVGMRLVLDGLVDPVQAGIFLIALRMKRETDDENCGVLDALREATLRVTAPVFTGTRRVIKEIVDRAGAALLLTLFAPVLLAVALAVAVDSRGGVFYRQRRVGKDGREFTIIKFRTMVRNADALRVQLAEANEGAGLLFKMRRDPRVTGVGTVLRRWSLDELPQLFNVLAGAMSLVGPRPPLPDETARYAPDVRRRLLVKPGLTGMWQISGRSDLSWDEAVRLDLRYVEDWSLALDAVILWKTARAVFRGDGAY